MNLLGALTVGVSGLQSQSNAIGVISDNVSNANTVGYKEGLPSFADLISNASSTTNYDPSGVTSFTTPLNNVQGVITTGNASTNMAISGSGFFPVSQNATSNGSILYTRAGSFSEDGNGNLVNAQGFYLQGFPVDANGNVASAVSGTADIASATAIPNLQTVNVNQLNEQPVPTTAVSIQANLQSTQAAYSGAPAYNAASSTANMASGAVQPQFDMPITVVDSNGASHTLEAGFLKTSNDSWAVEIYAQPASDASGTTNGQVTSGTVTFNGDGSLASVSPSLSQISVNWQNGTSNSISLNLGTAGQPFGTPGATSVGRTDGLSQNAAAYTLGNVQQNGVQAGTLTGVSVTSDGYITGSYNNGTTRNLYKIPVVDFVSPDQLQSQTGNVFTQTADSGPPNFLQSGQNGVGTIKGDALESSNVDTATQLSNLILAQNVYAFNSKIVSTVDTMQQDLNSMDQSITV